MEVNPNEISWTSDQNILLLNPRLSPQTKALLSARTAQTIAAHQLTSCIILASSGATVAEDKFIKLVVTAKNNFLANAENVRDFLNLNASNLWLRVLPLHHVGGLAILARSHVSSCSVISESAWDLGRITDILNDYPINYMSVVPTQVYDIVKNRIKPPTSMKALLVGGGFLAPELAESAAKLGWQILFTYGMTETSSMVSLSADQVLRPLKNVELSVNTQGILGIRCPSLAMGVIQQDPAGEFVFSPIRDSKGWFWTEDRVKKANDGYILLGRSSDFVKIGGEGTHLQALREIWEEVTQGQLSTAVWAIPSERLGHEIQLLIEESFDGSEVDLDSMKARFNHRVLPNQAIRSVKWVSSLPRNELGKILWKKLREEATR